MMKAIRFILATGVFALGCGSGAGSGIDASEADGNLDMGSLSDSVLHDDTSAMDDSAGKESATDEAAAENLVNADLVTWDSIVDVGSEDTLEVSAHDSRNDVSLDEIDAADCVNCPDDHVCIDRTCRCPDGLSDCLGQCVALGTNENCSACGDACVGHFVCDNSKCGQEMVAVPAGPFMQGCNAGIDVTCAGDSEKPYHEVNIESYMIDKYEVTVAAYRLCVDAGTCRIADGVISTNADTCNWYQSGRDEHPMNCILHGQAATYCSWAGKALCTESQWEKASRGTDGRIYPWGNDTATCERAVMVSSSNGAGCGRVMTWPVGSKPAGASPYGALDMSGNVSEWVQDQWHDDYTGAPTDGQQWLGSDGDWTKRVVRGGSFSGGDLRSSGRNGKTWQPSNPYDYQYAGVGFRCCTRLSWTP